MNNVGIKGGIFRLATLAALALSFSIAASAQNGAPPRGAAHRHFPAAPAATPPPTVVPGQTATPPPIANGLARTQLVPTQRPVTAPTVAPKNERGEQFFIVASVDLQKSQLLLKYPTEVTLLVKIDPKTSLQDEPGKPLQLTDFRAGDTVWVSSTTAHGDTEATATRILKGEMTVADLHKYYLDYAEIR